MRTAAAIAGALLLALVAVLALAPSEPAGLGTAPDLPDDLDAYLAAAEAGFDDLSPGTEKRILWAGEAGARTPLSVVYVHGFSATSEEVRPLPDELAAALGANLHFTRLAGHGRDMDTGGDAMGEATVAAWMTDLREAAAIGAAIGERTILVTVSTGGTLAALAAAEGLLPETTAGIAFLSPNLRPQNPAASLLTLPWARGWAPLVAGRTLGFEPRNEGHARWWTTRYPTVAAIPMAAAAQAARDADYASVALPAIFVFSDLDTVVDPAATRAVAAAWGGPARTETVVPGPEDDPDAHVLAGRILSPGLTEPVGAMLVDWAEGL